MRVPRVYIPQPLQTGAELLLDKGASKHLITVLRLQAGAELCLFNGEGGEYQATLLEAVGKQARVTIGEQRKRNTDSPLKIQLAIGISRGDRMDWVIQKATELGVNHIQPLLTERTEVKLKGDRVEKKVQHWQQIAISASEQSGRPSIPEIASPLKLADWTAPDTDLSLVLHHRSDGSLAAMVERKPASLCLLIGPEGGLSESEIDHALSHGFNALTLGPRVLRTETAPLAAISILQSVWGDMG